MKLHILVDIDTLDLELLEQELEAITNSYEILEVLDNE